MESNLQLSSDAQRREDMRLALYGKTYRLPQFMDDLFTRAFTPDELPARVVCVCVAEGWSNERTTLTIAECIHDDHRPVSDIDATILEALGLKALVTQ